jgi:hypothetical protein
MDSYQGCPNFVSSNTLAAAIVRANADACGQLRGIRMIGKFTKMATVATAGVVAISSVPAAAQMPQQPWTNADPAIKTTFIRLASGVPGVLYEPAEPGPKSAIAVFAMHSSADYTNFSACTELARRGYRVLCANNSTSKSGAFDEGALDRILLEAKAAVGWLRTIPGVRKVVLLGHSGGSAVMTAYQMIAENGVKACQGAEKLWKCPDTLAGLPTADGVILADANWGQPVMTLFSIDPAVIGENGMRHNPALDLFNPANGFKLTGSTYSAEFIRRFQAGAGQRSTSLLAKAQIKAGRGFYADDEPFFVPGASFLGWNNKLFTQDVRLLSRSLGAWPLVHKDGSVTTEQIHSVRPAMNTESYSGLLQRGALKTTVTGYLSSYAIRVTSDFGYSETSEVRGIDWRSSYATSVGNVEAIRVPLLTLGMTGGWEGLAAETIHAHAASQDKWLAFIEGATHLYTTCTRCETTPGQYGDTIKTTYDYIDLWLSKPGRLL